MSNQTMAKKKMRFVSAGYAWSGNWDNGDWYCSGQLGGKKYKIFIQDEAGNTAEAQRFSLISNGFKTGDKHPDWVLQLIVDPEEFPAEAHRDSAE